jgi:hypothetical protein
VEAVAPEAGTQIDDGRQTGRCTGRDRAAIVSVVYLARGVEGEPRVDGDEGLELRFFPAALPAVELSPPNRPVIRSSPLRSAIGPPSVRSPRPVRSTSHGVTGSSKAGTCSPPPRSRMGWLCTRSRGAKGRASTSTPRRRWPRSRGTSPTRARRRWACPHQKRAGRRPERAANRSRD